MSFNPYISTYKIICQICDSVSIYTYEKRPNFCPVCYSPHVIVSPANSIDDLDDESESNDQ